MGEDFTVVLYLQAILKIFVHEVEIIQCSPEFSSFAGLPYELQLPCLFVSLVLLLDESKVPVTIYQRYFEKMYQEELFCTIAL